METQKKHVAKSNRVTVPFYSPPKRHYGQTPSEIIREARASVMSLPTPGIKPVQTTRPYTPKEKERTLFGNVKKRLSRPPSAFSLSYLQKQETLPQIKLPAIGTYSKKKNRSSNFQSDHSLDNLVEEYEAEVLEELEESDFRGLPFFRDSHSSPLERKLIFPTSHRDKSSSKVAENRSIYTISHGCIHNVIPLSSEFNYCQNPSYGTGDCSRPRSKTLSACIPSQSLTDVKLQPEETIDYKEIEINACEETSRKKPHLVGEISREEESKISQNGSDVALTKTKKQSGSQRVEENYPKAEETNTFVENESILTTKDVRDVNDAVDLNNETQSLTEKCTETETVSEYLSLLNNGAQVPSRYENKKAKEILELYETAEYYDILDNTNTAGVSNVQNKTLGVHKKLEEDPFGEKIETEPKSSHLQKMKEHFKSFDLKMKKLSENIETFEEKLNDRNEANSSNKFMVGDSNTNDNYIFKMNDSKKYHVIDPISKRQEITHKQYLKDLEDVNRGREESQGPGWDGFWKNSYYEQKEVCADDVLENLDHLLGMLIKLDKADTGNAEISRITNKMYKLLKEGDLIHKHIITNEIKISILRTIYNFADSENPEILLSLARIVFSLKVENSLSAACKMAFKVARSDVNDHLFLEVEDILELFLDGIGLASPMDAAECCIYGYGALKFLTMNHRILSRLISLGVLDLLILHLKIINSAKMEGQTVNEQTQHALFQLTGALRNIAAADGVLSLFITTNSIPILCKILNHFRQCEDLVTNISRTLSLLSADEDATDILMSVDNILGIIIDLIDQYKSNDNILIRLSYCLGNIVAYNDLARVQLSRSDVSVNVLLGVLHMYVDKDLELSVEENPKSGNDGIGADAVDDIIVKVIRIIANMCMNPVVGSNLSPNESNEKNSLKLSQLLTTLLKRKDPGITLLACLGCLNNISYYCGNHSSLIDITEGVIRVLTLHDEECQAEAARVLGNLTRHKEIRDLMFSTGGIHQLAKLLDSKHKDVYRSACGALVNLMLDHETRITFLESHGIDKLVSGLEKFSGDWSFSALICRAIWNSCADDMELVMSHNDVDKLLHILAYSLDEENWNDGDPAWEEFAVLATDLLEKINAHLEVQ